MYLSLSIYVYKANQVVDNTWVQLEKYLQMLNKLIWNPVGGCDCVKMKAIMEWT